VDRVITNQQKQGFKGILFTIMPDKQEENRNNRGQSVKSTVFARQKAGARLEPH
jgi:hypothetical protein